MQTFNGSQYLYKGPFLNEKDILGVKIFPGTRPSCRQKFKLFFQVLMNLYGLFQLRNLVNEMRQLRNPPEKIGYPPWTTNNCEKITPRSKDPVLREREGQGFFIVKVSFSCVRSFRFFLLISIHICFHISVTFASKMKHSKYHVCTEISYKIYQNVNLSNFPTCIFC